MKARCKLCGIEFEQENPKIRLCDHCLGLDTESKARFAREMMAREQEQALREMDAPIYDIPEPSKPDAPTRKDRSKPYKICKICKSPVEPWQNGGIRITKICKDCFFKRAGQNKTIIHWHHRQDIKDELMAWVKEEAAREFRSVDDQIIYLLVRAWERAEGKE